MDFHALPRRDLQALCKSNAIRANMSNAAMADALRSLQSVEGIDEIRTAPSREMSAVKSTAEEVAVIKQRHGCPLLRGCRSQAATKRAAAQKTEEAALAPDILLMSHQNMAARNADAPVDEEAVSTGKRRTRRSKRSKAKMVSDQQGEAPVAEQKEPIIEPVLLDKKSAVGEETHNGCVLPCGSRGRVTRSKAAARETEDAAPALSTFQRTQKTEAQEASVPIEVEEVSTGKRRTRRSRRSKMKVVLDKQEEEAAVAKRTELKADSSDAAIRPAVISEKMRDDPKEEAVIDEEATKPQEGEMHYQNPSSGKRRTRRPTRQNVKMALDKKELVAAAARKELIADSSDGVVGSAVVRDNYFNDEKVSLVEVGATNFQEEVVEELESTSNVQKSPSLAIMKDSPIQCVLSMAESRGPVIEMAQHASVRGGGGLAELPVDEMTFKMNPYTQDREDGFSLTSEVDQSNLLVNTLDRFVKPMYKFIVKEEKQQGECWWMLM